MYCRICGKTIPDDSLFCAYCGKPITSTTSTNDDQSIWEYCEIVWDGKYGPFLDKWRDVYFWASAIGKKGKYTAGESPHYDLRLLANNPPIGLSKQDGEKAADAHSILVNKLIKEGWQPTEEIGRAWWNQKFKRNVSNSS